MVVCLSPSAFLFFWSTEHRLISNPVCSCSAVTRHFVKCVECTSHRGDGLLKKDVVYSYCHSFLSNGFNLLFNFKQHNTVAYTVVQYSRLFPLLSFCAMYLNTLCLEQNRIFHVLIKENMYISQLIYLYNNTVPEIRSVEATPWQSFTHSTDIRVPQMFVMHFVPSYWCNISVKIRLNSFSKFIAEVIVNFLSP